MRWSVRLFDYRGKRSPHTVTSCLVAKSLIAAMGSGEIPTTVMPESLNSTFSNVTVHKVIDLISLHHEDNKREIGAPVSASRKAQTSLVQPKVPVQHPYYKPSDYDEDRRNAPALG